MNSINVIAPYKFAGRMWVFDDPRLGLVQEAFISGADIIIDRAVAHIPDAAAGFVLIFSSIPFPGHAFHLEWRRSDSDGNWYYARDFDVEENLAYELEHLKDEYAAPMGAFLRAQEDGSYLGEASARTST